MVDVTEILENTELNFKNDSFVTKGHANKKVKVDIFGAGEIERDKRVEELHNKNDIDKYVEENASNTTEPLNEATLKKMLLNFEKKILRNQELRIKHPDQPQKFFESELALNDHLQEMHIISTAPELYTILISCNTISSLISLISHENTDISSSVVDLLQELTEPDALLDAPDDFITQCLSNQLVSCLIQNLERLDESVKEESDAVHNSLTISRGKYKQMLMSWMPFVNIYQSLCIKISEDIVENICEIRPEICADIGKQKLIAWLLKRIKAKMPFDVIKLYCGEVLAILIQNCDENRSLIGSLNGIDILLQQIAYFKRQEPNSREEGEYMNNLFDILCSCLMLSSNKSKFLNGEGLQLMNLLLREKKSSRCGAIKVVNHALTGKDGVECCKKFVQIYGLRTIFPLFMKCFKIKGKYGDGLSLNEIEEHICSIIVSLMKNTSHDVKQRLLSKFHEQDYVKVDRLMELHFKYLSKVTLCESKMETLMTNYKSGKLSEEMADEVYMRRLDAGLFTLQIVDHIILELCGAGGQSDGIKIRVKKILNMHSSSIEKIKDIMLEYVENINEEEGASDEAKMSDNSSKSDSSIVTLSSEKNTVLSLLYNFLQ